MKICRYFIDGDHNDNNNNNNNNSNNIHSSV